MAASASARAHAALSGLDTPVKPTARKADAALGMQEAQTMAADPEEGRLLDTAAAALEGWQKQRKAVNAALLARAREGGGSNAEGENGGKTTDAADDDAWKEAPPPRNSVGEAEERRAEDIGGGGCCKKGKSPKKKTIKSSEAQREERRLRYLKEKAAKHAAAAAAAAARTAASGACGGHLAAGTAPKDADGTGGAAMQPQGGGGQQHTFTLVAERTRRANAGRSYFQRIDATTAAAPPHFPSSPKAEGPGDKSKDSNKRKRQVDGKTLKGGNRHGTPAAARSPAKKKRRVHAAAALPPPPPEPLLPDAPVFYPTVEEFANPLAYINAIIAQAAHAGIARIVPPLPTQGARRVARLFERGLVAKAPAVSLQSAPSPSKPGRKQQHLRIPTKAQLVRGFAAAAVPQSRATERAVTAAGGRGGKEEEEEQQEGGSVHATGEEASQQKEEANPATVAPLRMAAAPDNPLERNLPEAEEALPATDATSVPSPLPTARRKKKKSRASGTVYSSRREDPRKVHRRAKQQQHRFAPGFTRMPSEFQAMAAEFARSRFIATPSAREVEDDYWAEMAKPVPRAATRVGWQTSNDPELKSCRVEYGGDMPGTAFGTRAEARAAGDELAASSWNLSEFAADADDSDGGPMNLFALLDESVPGVTSPMLYIGMCFSTFAWHVEDHDLLSINYLHAGSPKTWYGVPAAHATNFEQALHESVYRMPTVASHLDAQDRVSQKTTMFPPSTVLRHGGSVYRAVQHPGEYIVTFPRAYHAGFSHGFNVGEAVNFAIPSWFAFGRAAAERYGELRKSQIFDHERLSSLYVVLQLRRLAHAMLDAESVAHLRHTPGADVDDETSNVLELLASVASEQAQQNDGARSVTPPSASMPLDPAVACAALKEAFVSQLDALLVSDETGTLTPFGMGAVDFLRGVRATDTGVAYFRAACDSRLQSASTSAALTLSWNLSMPPAPSGGMHDARCAQLRWEGNPVPTLCAECQKPCYFAYAKLAMGDERVECEAPDVVASDAAPSPLPEPSTLCLSHAAEHVVAHRTSAAEVLFHPRLRLFAAVARLVESRLHHASARPGVSGPAPAVALAPALPRPGAPRDAA